MDEISESDSDSGTSVLGKDVVSSSESSRDDIQAADAFSSSSSDIENGEGSEIIPDNNLDNGGSLVAVETVPSHSSTVGPFTAEFFSTIPGNLLRVASDDEDVFSSSSDED